MSSTKCSACKDGMQKPMAFSMAFQPIVNIETGKPWAYEALVRGPQGESAWSVLSQVTEENRYAFDQNCRVQALSLASRLGLQHTGALLSINFLPGAVYSAAACIQLTLNTARALNFPTDRLIFEITEGEKVRDANHLQAIANEYRKHGFRIAIDDFGAGFSDLSLLSELTADILKLDMVFTRDLHRKPRTAAIIRSIVALGNDLGMPVVAEGIETVEEYQALRHCGIHLMQGYLFAKPGFEQLPECTIPELCSSATLATSSTTVSGQEIANPSSVQRPSYSH